MPRTMLEISPTMPAACRLHPCRCPRPLASKVAPPGSHPHSPHPKSSPSESRTSFATPQMALILSFSEPREHPVYARTAERQKSSSEASPMGRTDKAASCKRERHCRSVEAVVSMARGRPDGKASEAVRVLQSQKIWSREKCKRREKASCSVRVSCFSSVLVEPHLTRILSALTLDTTSHEYRDSGRESVLRICHPQRCATSCSCRINAEPREARTWTERERLGACFPASGKDRRLCLAESAAAIFAA